MRSMGHNPTMDEARSIIRDVDNDENGTIDLFEFVSILKRWPVIDMNVEHKKLIDSFRY